MKTSIYLENADIKAAVKEIGKTNDLGVTFAKVDHQFGLKHDDLAQAMYIAKEAGTDDKENVKTMLKQAYANGEIGREYLERWMDADDIDAIEVAVG